MKIETKKLLVNEFIEASYRQPTDSELVNLEQDCFLIVKVLIKKVEILEEQMAKLVKP